MGVIVLLYLKEVIFVRLLDEDTMKRKLVLFGKYAMFWMALFAFGRLLFVIYQWDLIDELDGGLFFGAFLNGGRLDLSITSYFLALVAVVMAVFAPFKGRVTAIVLRVISVLLLLPVLFGIVTDLVLYEHWGTRLDSAPLVYLSQPDVIFRSSSTLEIATVLVSYVLLIAVMYWLLNKFVFKPLSGLDPQKWFMMPAWLFVGALMIVPIRGGFGLAPINTGAAYFSGNLYANHVAINPIFNFGYSMKSYGAINKPYKFMESEQAEAIFSDLMRSYPTVNVLNNKRPNVVMILLESFSAKAIGHLGGRPNVTPNLEQIGREGIWFDRMYSTSNRSDKGMVGVLSGYPVQPTLSIMKFPQKTQNLPFITKSLMAEGYNTSFYYGGDLGFANMISYVTNGGFEKVVSMADFPESTYNAKWGVHDEVMFESLLADINASKEPFFKFFFTLSSHEPFDVPMETVIADNAYLNSVYYTDKCLGEFWTKAKKEPWFDKTLFVFVADHGVRMIDNLSNTNPERYHIPMVWAGGALSKTDTVISKYGSQSDIANTLLTQLAVPVDDYKFSKDLLSAETKGFAFFDYSDGFGFVSPDIKQVYDNTSKSYYLFEGQKSKQDSVLGKAYLQVMYNDYVGR